METTLVNQRFIEVLAATFQDERKESTKGVATRPAACQGELLSTTSRDLIFRVFLRLVTTRRTFMRTSASHVNPAPIGTAGNAV